MGRGDSVFIKQIIIGIKRINTKIITNKKERKNENEN